MAFVLFVIYIPNEGDPGGQVSEDDRAEVGVSESDVDDDVASFKTADPSPRHEHAQVMDKMEAIPDTGTNGTCNDTTDGQAEKGDVSTVQTDVGKSESTTDMTEKKSDETGKDSHEQGDVTDDVDVNNDGSNDAEGQTGNDAADDGDDETADHEYFYKHVPLSERLEEKLDELHIENHVWKTSRDNLTIQVSFVEESGLRCEEIISALSKIDIGRRKNTTLSVFPTSIHVRYEENPPGDGDEEEVGNHVSKDDKDHEFKKSIKSRLVVQQVVESVNSNAQLTFDYVMFIFLASWIAALGLGENSSVILVASMLISPLMGPILAVIFGAVVKNEDLWKTGLKSELIGLGICLVFGLVAGCIYGVLGVHGQVLGNSNSWPTTEMSSRGVWRSLIVGLLIAIPSGAGVALSILGGNIGSLVGVAISASLLPPAVNAGMLWALAITAAAKPPGIVTEELSKYIFIPMNSTNVTDPTMPRGLECPPFMDNAYRPAYSCTMATEAVILGCISLLLTFINIVAIFFVGLLVLKLKEVAPNVSPTKPAEDFFHKDLKIARASYTTTKGRQSVTLARDFLDEYRNINHPETGEDTATKQSIKTLYFRDVLEDVENSPDVQQVLSTLHNGKQNRPLSVILEEDFNTAERGLRAGRDYNTAMSPLLDVHAQVYRTVTAADQFHPLSPNILYSPNIRNSKKNPFCRQWTCSHLPTSKPTAPTAGQEMKPLKRPPQKSLKRPQLKLDVGKHVSEPEPKPPSFHVVTIQDRDSNPVLPDKKPRFEVETYPEKEPRSDNSPMNTPSVVRECVDDAGSSNQTEVAADLSLPREEEKEALIKDNK